MISNKLSHKTAGFSLMEVMVSVALVGGLALGLVKFMGNMSDVQQRSSNAITRDQFANNMGQYIYTPMGCEDLKGQRFNSSDKAINLTRWKVFGLASIATGTKLKGFDIAKLEGEQDLSPTLPRVTIGGQTLIKTILKVNLLLSTEGKTKKFFFNIPVLSDTGGTVRFCNADQSLRETCVLMKGTYNEATGACDVDKTCQFKGTYITLSCSPSNYGCSMSEGAAKPNEYTTGFSCPVPSIAHNTSNKSWNHSASCGKKCSVTIQNTMNWYTCLVCPP